MISAFGVSHDISKADKRRLPDRLPDSLAAVTPGTVTRAYDESPRPRKVKNASRNMGAKVAGGAVGSGIALAAATPFLRKVKGNKVLIKAPAKLAGGKPVAFTSGQAKPYLRAGALSLGGSAGSSVAGSTSYKKIRRENKQWQ